MKKYAFFMISLQRIMVLIRSDVSSKKYLEYLIITKKIMESMDEDHKMYKELCNLLKDSEEKSYILKKDKKTSLCTNWNIVKQSIDFIKICIDKIIDLLQRQAYGQAYDFVDWFHAFPEAILLKANWNEESFREIYVIPYEKKWSCDVKFCGEAFKVHLIKSQYGGGRNSG